MKADYSDILTLAKTEPLWYDEVGCPRFVEFHPSLCSNAYAKHAKLLRISCQNCGKQFLACVSTDEENRNFSVSFFYNSYKDPPRHSSEDGESCIGNTMNSNPVSIVVDWSLIPEGGESR